MLLYSVSKTIIKYCFVKAFKSPWILEKLFLKCEIIKTLLVISIGMLGATKTYTCSVVGLEIYPHRK